MGGEKKTRLEEKKGVLCGGESNNLYSKIWCIWKNDITLQHIYNIVIVAIINNNDMESTIKINKNIFDESMAIAKQKGVDLSNLVESYLSNLIRRNKDKSKNEDLPEVISSLLGAGEPLDGDDINGRKAYSKYLTEKYK